MSSFGSITWQTGKALTSTLLEYIWGHDIEVFQIDIIFDFTLHVSFELLENVYDPHMSVAHYWFLSGMVSSSLNAYSFLVLMDFICTTCGRWSEFVSEMLVMYRPGEEGTCLCLTFINPDADWEELKGLLPEGCADLEKRKQRSKWFSFTN